MKTQWYRGTPRVMCCGLAALAVTLLCAPTARGAGVRLHKYFTDNMVLQRDRPVLVKGWAAPGRGVKVKFGDQEKTTVADDEGRWSVTLDAMPASDKGRRILCRGSAGWFVTISNVVVGDVFLFGRQSSIDVSLGRNDEGRAVAARHRPTDSFRAVRIKTVPAKRPQEDLGSELSSGWARVDAKTALAMSAAAFHLGRDLDRELDVPVGIVDIDMGPYFAIGWLSGRALSDSVTLHPDDQEVSWLPKFMMDLAEERDSGKAQKELDDWYEERYGKARAEGKPVPPKPSLGLHPLENPTCASVGYDAVIHPLKGIALKAILLQLGNDYPFVPYAALAASGKVHERPELDEAWAQTYKILKHGYRVTPATLPLVPKDWRRAFGDEKLPVGLVMPPGSDLYAYALHGREIREMHRRMQQETPGLGLIMPGTEHIPLSGQPADDRLLAERCRCWVLGAVCGRADVAAMGPLFERAESKLSKATVYFKEETARGLKATGDALDLFEVAGPDGEWATAAARIDGSTVRIESDQVNQIEFIRYNWRGRPELGLVNSSGLPALPFSTDADWEFAWIVPNPPPQLPSEYETPANEWSKSDVAIVNGSLVNARGGDSQPTPKWIGPTGIFSDPFGPNIYVHRIEPGSPAHGKVLPGDVIFSANGKAFGDDTYRELAAAITHSESEAGGGKLVLGIRRRGGIIDVTLELDVMGSFSSTTPFYCAKSERIVEKAEQYLERRSRPASGVYPSNAAGFLDTDVHFLMAAGTPKYQGLVRRVVYEKMARMTPLKPAAYGNRAGNWQIGHNALLFGEYFHATGDRNVLPYLKNQTEWAAITQLKPRAETPEEYEAAPSDEQVGGWRHNGFTAAGREKSGYGLLPHAGMACVMGMALAREAGLKIDELAYRRGLTHFRDGRAEHGFVLYSYYGLRRKAPIPVDPDAEAKGKLSSMNGKLGMAAALFDLVEDRQPADICARFCVYGFNNTRHGHGGMFFNNYWTPIGAHVAGEKGFKHFMKGQTWWRELYRRHDGSFTQDGRGGIGAAYALHYVAQHKRLRMLGAPKSAFGVNPPEYLKPALEAHKKRDYALCERLILEEMKERVIPAEERPVVDQLLQSVRGLRESIAYDLAYTERLVKERRYYQARLELPQLRGVVAEDNARLKAIARVLESPEVVAQANREGSRLRGEWRRRDAERRKAAQPADKEDWVCLLTEVGFGRDRTGFGKTTEDRASKWRMKVVESVTQAPEGWTQPGFDDSGWVETTLPVSWRLYHTALFRGKFRVDDKDEFKALRIRGLFFRQLNVVVHLNGVLVAKIDNIGRGTSPVTASLTDLALESLRNGENTITVTTRHDRRWGPLRGTYTTVSYSGVKFMLDARRAR